MNVFVDSGILYDDPYWQGAFNRLLLDRARQGVIRLYLSDLVHKAIFRGHVRHVDESFRMMNDAADVLYNQYSNRTGDVNARPRRSFLDEFHAFYDGLIRQQIITIIPSGEGVVAAATRQAFDNPGSAGQDRDITSPRVLLTYNEFVGQHGLRDAYLLTTRMNAREIITNMSGTQTIPLEGKSVGFDTSRLFFSSRQLVKTVMAKRVGSELDIPFFQGMDGARLTDILKRFFTVQIESAVERMMKSSGLTHELMANRTVVDHFLPKITSWQGPLEINERISTGDVYIIMGVQLFAGTVEGLFIQCSDERKAFYPYGPVEVGLRAGLVVTFTLAGAPVHWELSSIDFDESR